MVFDCFIFFNELDLLAVRLEELKDVVDRFVLVEGTRTFTNKPKPLYYAENKDRFSSFNDRIIHVVVDDFPIGAEDAWEYEYFQRNAIARGLTNCAPGDIVIISDLDEIPRASAVADFNGEIAFLEQNLYYYRLNCLCTTEKWAVPLILRYRNLTTPQEVRMYWYDQARRQEIPTIPDAGWHFSFLGDIESIQCKLASFSHQELNTPAINNREAIERKIDAGEDLFGRERYRWSFVKIDETYPSVIYDNRYKYAQYIKGRDLESTVCFDQYSRYRACADVLQSLCGSGETILDVGSGVEALMGEFLPDRDITFIDPLIANLPHRPAYMLAGDAFSPELDGRSFDFVVCIDALEHVPGQYRQDFIGRLASLARKGVVLAFPAADVGDATGTDRWLNDVFKAAYGTDYCWLEEHLQNGLPSLGDVVEQLQADGWKTTVRQNGHTPWMRELLAFTLCGLEEPSFRPTVMELNTFFNRELQPYDSTLPAYRQIVVATRFEQQLPPELETAEEIPLRVANCWDELHQRMIGAPYSILKELSGRLVEKELKSLEVQRHIVQRDQQLKEKERQVNELKSLLAELEQAIAMKDRELVETEVRIDGLLSSLSWRVTGPVRTLIDKVSQKRKQD